MAKLGYEQGATGILPVIDAESTIRNATKILVFQNGQVVESGTFDELVEKGGRCAEFARAQFMVQGPLAATSQLLATAELNK